ncbi:hypothetical protein ABIB25_003870 [Nakamurella sp. UYEF19]|uniref:hypothetical protein n=1 Tax=Nakamurella sp. UYEF19 TaxID=1756392 RepID=UPI0033986C75
MEWKLMVDLLPSSDLPPEFSYPVAFLRLIDNGILDFEPWQLLFGEILVEMRIGLGERYPTRQLVPFARRINNDDVACWDLDTGDIAIVHDWASPGWEQRARFPDFKAWLRAAFDEFIDYE